MTTQIPPLDEQLQFAKHKKTGAIHIMSWYPARETVPFAEVTFSSRVLVLCGRTLWDPSYAAGDDFPDDALCHRCVHALGDQQWRAFHVDNRGPE